MNARFQLDTGSIGNQVGKVRLAATSLASLVGSPFDIVVWCGVHQPISAERVLEHVQVGHMLPPGPGQMGDELSSLDEHERRVAWLYANSASWAPVVAAQADRSEPSLALIDGHHRLAAALLQGSTLEVLVEGGLRSHVAQLLSANDGVWLDKPSTEVFGAGVFPLEELGGAALRVYGEKRRCWIEDMATGECVARYGHNLWTVGSSLTDVGVESAIGEAARHRQAAVRSPDTSQHEHLAGFIKACEPLVTGQGAHFGAFIQAVVEGKGR